VQIATVKETGISYAVKILNKKHIINQKKVAWVNREKVLLDRLRHPNIVDLFYTFSDPDNLRMNAHTHRSTQAVPAALPPPPKVHVVIVACFADCPVQHRNYGA
jgi:serine/threonine protein kinase